MTFTFVYQQRSNNESRTFAMTAILNAIQGTPLWVWALLAFLIFIGVRSLKDATVSIARIAILPLFFLAWGLQGMLTTYAMTAPTASAWIAGLTVGAAAGWLLVSTVALRADKENKLIHLPGSPINLVMILLIFATKYAFGYTIASRPGIIADPSFAALSVGVSGLLTGILVGRFWGLWRKYQGASHQTLAAA
jgi:hypothetical protein